MSSRSLKSDRSPSGSRQGSRKSVRDAPATSSPPNSRGGSIGSRGSSRSKGKSLRNVAKQVSNLKKATSPSPTRQRGSNASGKSGFSMSGTADYSEEGKRTTLYFIFLDGKKETIELERRPRTYWDLQQVIITKKRKCKNMFAIRNDKKQFVTAANYKPQDVLHVTEFVTSLNMKNHPLEEIRWEFYKYHGKPAQFHDKMEERLQAKAAAKEEARLKREEEERINAEFLKNKDKDINEDLNDM
mmetsp:Transcript_14255/g.23597  ORF Transcript_14255/g.23597 Transcript_14255/m.23597 type:complete len:243 (-) Transcript_14255:33-761(-)